MPDPAVSREMESGPEESRASNRSRFSSPRAAKTGAGVLRRSAKVFPNILQLPGPALVVLPVGLAPPRDWYPVEAGFGYGKASSFGGVFQLEDHQGLGL